MWNDLSNLPRTQHWTTGTLRAAAVGLAAIGVVAAWVAAEHWPEATPILVAGWAVFFFPTCLVLALASVLADCVIYLARTQHLQARRGMEGQADEPETTPLDAS